MLLLFNVEDHVAFVVLVLVIVGAIVAIVVLFLLLLLVSVWSLVVGGWAEGVA